MAAGHKTLSVSPVEVAQPRPGPTPIKGPPYLSLSLSLGFSPSHSSIHEIPLRLVQRHFSWRFLAPSALHRWCFMPPSGGANGPRLACTDGPKRETGSQGTNVFSHTHTHSAGKHAVNTVSKHSFGVGDLDSHRKSFSPWHPTPTLLPQVTMEIAGQRGGSPVMSLFSLDSSRLPLCLCRVTAGMCSCSPP